jgi:hypothetical protein
MSTTASIKSEFPERSPTSYRKSLPVARIRLVVAIAGKDLINTFDRLVYIDLTAKSQ